MRAGFPGIMSAASNRSFLPINITGNQLWLDASDTSTITTATGVSIWADKSGNGNNATQGTGSSQPATGVTTQNGKNIIDFDGTKHLILPSALYTIPTGDLTMFVASKRNDGGASLDCLVGMGEDGVNNGHFLLYNGTGELLFRNRQAAGTIGASGTNTNFNVNRGRREGTTQAAAINGGTESTAATATDPTTVDIALIGLSASASLFLDGSIGEIIIYNRSLSTAEITQVETYLTNKWAIV